MRIQYHVCCFILRLYSDFKLSWYSRVFTHFFLKLKWVRLITIWTDIAVCRLFWSLFDRGSSVHCRAVVGSPGCNRRRLVRSRDYCVVTYDALSDTRTQVTIPMPWAKFLINFNLLIYFFEKLKRSIYT